jgi:poly(3-hydroxybutyrate) depolymerase
MLLGPLAAAQQEPSAEPTTVVLALHAGSRSGENLRTNLGWGDQRQGIDILYPDGDGGHWNSGWDASQSTRDDVSYLLDLVAGYDRVLLYGQSQGGMMAYRLACEHPELIDRIAVESAAVAVDVCAPEGIEVTHWHGKLDTTVPKWGNGDLWPLWRTRRTFSAECGTEVRRLLPDGAWAIRFRDCPGMTGPYAVETRVYPDRGHTGYPEIWPAYAWWWLTHAG